MAEEDSTKLYHRIALCSLFFVDATGNLFEKVKKGGEFLYNAMVAGHPFNLAQPLLVAELITNEHDIDFIRRLFRKLRTCERKIYKPSCKATPLGIMMGFCLAIISSALLEYNNESYLEYMQRTFEIMTGKVKKKFINHLFVFICTAYIMKNVKKLAARGDPMNTSMKHFAMRFFGRLIHACSLEEVSSIVKVGFIVLNSQYVTPEVSAATEKLTHQINTFTSDVVLPNLEEDDIETSGTLS